MPVAPERIQLVFQKLERDLIKLSSKHDAERVHNFRTTARRLETLFEQLLPKLDRSQKKLLKALTRIRKRAGKIRDLDVQLAALRNLKVPQEPRRKTQLIHALIDLRAESESKLRKALTKETVREIRKRLHRARKDLPLEQSRDPLQTAHQMLSLTAQPDQPLTEKLLHQYRILTKRVRYVAEFASQTQEADRLIAQLKRAQDALGDWHDWLMLTQTAAHRLGDVHESPLVAVLQNLTGAKFRKAVPALTLLRPTNAATKQHAVKQRPETSSGAPSRQATSAA